MRLGTNGCQFVDETAQTQPVYIAQIVEVDGQQVTVAGKAIAQMRCLLVGTGEQCTDDVQVFARL
jgi:hypothetical protein